MWRGHVGGGEGGQAAEQRAVTNAAQGCAGGGAGKEQPRTSPCGRRRSQRAGIVAGSMAVFFFGSGRHPRGKRGRGGKGHRSPDRRHCRCPVPTPFPGLGAASRPMPRSCPTALRHRWRRRREPPPRQPARPAAGGRLPRSRLLTVGGGTAQGGEARRRRPAARRGPPTAGADARVAVTTTWAKCSARCRWGGKRARGCRLGTGLRAVEGRLEWDEGETRPTSARRPTRSLTGSAPRQSPRGDSAQCRAVHNRNCPALLPTPPPAARALLAATATPSRILAPGGASRQLGAPDPSAGAWRGGGVASGGVGATPQCPPNTRSSRSVRRVVAGAEMASGTLPKVAYFNSLSLFFFCLFASPPAAQVHLNAGGTTSLTHGAPKQRGEPQPHQSCWRAGLAQYVEYDPVPIATATGAAESSVSSLKAFEPKPTGQTRAAGLAHQ